MSVTQTIVEKAVEWAYRHFTATQICWLCLAATLGLGWLVTAQYAPANEVRELRDIVTELRADTTAKRIFDYRVRQCDTPPEERQTKRWLADQIREDVNKYRKVTGDIFELPACSDL